MVPSANAVVDPGAVVVEAVDALVANVAVSASGESDYFALRTQAGGLELFKQVKEVNFWGFLDNAWVH